jgi:hypothetical protein
VRGIRTNVGLMTTAPIPLRCIAAMADIWCALRRSTLTARIAATTHVKFDAPQANPFALA